MFSSWTGDGASKRSPGYNFPHYGEVYSVSTNMLEIVVLTTDVNQYTQFFCEFYAKPNHIFSSWGYAFLLALVMPLLLPPQIHKMSVTKKLAVL